VAAAHAAADPELAEAIWLAGASAIGWGAGEDYALAKGLARDHSAGARDALRQVTVPELRDASPA
jgi:hypothetical protein